RRVPVPRAPAADRVAIRLVRQTSHDIAVRRVAPARPKNPMIAVSEESTAPSAALASRIAIMRR
ncbi:MAG: hypothetical protein WBV74_18130, partial [Pseudonocardiaceae bacterium]